MNEGNLDSSDKGTCARDNGGKVKFSLLPMHLLAGVARVLMFGSKKYAPWNWAKGGPWSTAFDCAMRHMLKFWYCRDECDDESKLHHLDHAICNLLFLRHYTLSYMEGDDRPPEFAMIKEQIEFFKQPPLVDCNSYDESVKRCLNAQRPVYDKKSSSGEGFAPWGGGGTVETSEPMAFQVSPEEEKRIGARRGEPIHNLPPWPGSDPCEGDRWVTCARLSRCEPCGDCFYSTLGTRYRLSVRRQNTLSRKEEALEDQKNLPRSG
jgi:hypothetical protein